MKQRIVLFLTLSFTALLAAAQSFTAKVEPAGGYYRLTFTVASDGVEDFTPPNLSAFEKLSGPMPSTFSSLHVCALPAASLCFSSRCFLNAVLEIVSPQR